MVWIQYKYICAVHIILWLWISKYIAYSLNHINLHSAVPRSTREATQEKFISWVDFYLTDVYFYHDAFQVAAMFVITVLSSRKTFLLFQKLELVLCSPVHLHITISCSSMRYRTALWPKDGPCSSFLKVNCTGSKRGRRYTAT